MLPDAVDLTHRLSAGDWTGATDALRAAAEGHAQDWLCTLHDALRAIPSPDQARLCRLVVEALALTPGAVDLLVARLPQDEPAAAQWGHADTPARRLAARLAVGQPLEALHRALEHAADPRWHAIVVLWIQEVVVRGADLSGDRELARFWSSLDHPLASMPLALHPLESASVRGAHRYSALSASGWGGGPQWHQDAVLLPAGRPPPSSTRLLLSPGEVSEITACYASACEVSNGHAEAAVFELSAPAAALTSGLIASLRLSCFGSYDPSVPVACGGGLRAQGMDLGTTYALLMSEASNGGCYNSGWSGAWGRLAAWRSLGGLVGARGSLDMIAAAAEGCQFATFSVDSSWFNRVMSDPVVVCLRLGGRVVVVFAGSDTD